MFKKTKQKLLISSCLLGELVKYNGGHNLIDESYIERLQKNYQLYPFCPEVQGGMSTPRVPCEIVSNNPIKVMDKDAYDQTKFFIDGANKALELCIKYKIKKALLKSNSPSCGSEYIYDGTFSGDKIKGEGITTKILRKNNILVVDEINIDILF